MINLKKVSIRMVPTSIRMPNRHKTVLQNRQPFAPLDTYSHPFDTYLHHADSSLC